MKNLYFFVLLNIGFALQGMNNQSTPIQNIFYRASLSSQSELTIQEITPELYPDLCRRMLAHDPVSQNFLSYDSATHAIYVSRDNNLKGVVKTQVILQAVSEYRKKKKMRDANSVITSLSNKIDHMGL